MAKIKIVVGSVAGNAERLADHVAAKLQATKHQVLLSSQPSLDFLLDPQMDLLIVVCSTTGSGDIPANIAPLFYEMRDKFPLFPQLKFGVIALGDRSFGDTFCGAGRQWNELLLELQAMPCVSMLELDACDSRDPLELCDEWLDTAPFATLV